MSHYHGHTHYSDKDVQRFLENNLTIKLYKFSDYDGEGVKAELCLSDEVISESEVYLSYD